MKITKEQYKLFKDECELWRKKLGVNDWRIEYYTDKETDSRAYVRRDLTSQTVNIFLGTNWIENNKYNDSVEEINEKIKYSSKHEMLHVLIGKLAELGDSRFVTSSETYRTEEELVTKLINIIE